MDMFEDFVNRIHDYFAFNDPIYYHYLDECIVNDFVCGHKLTEIVNEEYERWLFLGDLKKVIQEIKEFLTKYYRLDGMNE